MNTPVSFEVESPLPGRLTPGLIGVEVPQAQSILEISIDICEVIPEHRGANRTVVVLWLRGVPRVDVPVVELVCFVVCHSCDPVGNGLPFLNSYFNRLSQPSLSRFCVGNDRKNREMKARKEQFQICVELWWALVTQRVDQCAVLVRDKGELLKRRLV